MKRAPVLFVIILFCGLYLTPVFAETITTGSLVKEMVDLRRLGDFPNPAYKTIQFSSYDHRSDLPGGPKWFANSDGFGGEPIPAFEKVLKEPGDDKIGEYLICDVKGPGAVVRLWTAAIKGNIRLYLDGQDDPIFDDAADVFLRKTYGPFLKDSGLDEDFFADVFSQRNACYFPIPFAKGCRIVWTGNVKNIHFYQIQVRLYEESASVETFKPADLKTYKQDFLEVQNVLRKPDARWRYTSEEAPIEMAAVVAPGESKEMLFQKGPKAVERLTLKVRADELDAALKQTLLEIHFDEHPWGQVQSPLGDFFGAAPGVNPYDSVPFTVKPDGEMTCRFVMPFKESVRIMLINKGARPVSIGGSVLLSDYVWRDESSMHFRARWRVDHDLAASNNRVQDLPFLLANGRGVYVGTSSMLLNPNEIPSSYGNWWGEGDEKIFTDDDVRPSTFGTGSEDYYNYAWSSGEIFVHPYFGQPRNDGPANRGFVTNHRWHILDPLPFQYRLSFYMELFSHEETPDVSYARLSYLYGKPGMMDDHLPITGEDVRLLELPENWQPASKMGAANSIFFGAENLSAPGADVELVYDNLWQGGSLMVWRPKEEGATLDLPFELQEEGEYVIRLAAARTPSSGKMTVLLDSRPLDLGGVIDLATPYRTLLRATPPSPKMKLEKGEHTITLRFEGKSGEESVGEIGVDFIWLQR